MTAGTNQVQSPTLNAQLLGPVLLAVGERRLRDQDWPPRGGRELLLLLLTTPGHQISRDRLIDALWPDLAPGAARNAYYKAVHSLRRVLEPGLEARQSGSYVVTIADRVALADASYAVDVDRFEALVRGVEGRADQEQRARLSEALALYRGDLFEGEQTPEWGQARRDALRQARCDALLTLAAIELKANHIADAISVLQGLLDLEPTREEGHRLLIDAYGRAGQRDLARRQYERCVAVLRDELGVDPSAETVRAANRVLGLDLASTRSVARHPWRQVPAPPTRLVGRVDELDDLLAAIERHEGRLLTLVGPGGVGKTRLAVEAAREAESLFPAGVCFVSLAALRDSRMVAPEVARALGLRQEQGADPLDQIVAALRDRSLLLVLDNFEHVLDGASTVARILAECSAVKILATSREPLRLRAERLCDVPPLAVPMLRSGGRDAPELGVVAQAAAVELFVARAADVDPTFSLHAGNAVTVATICARLDGLPLAIELAAARVRELPPERLLALLDDRLATLVAGYLDLPSRQRTMRDAIAWSYDLLDPDLRILLRRLAVCAGGATADLAAAMTGAHPPLAATGIDRLVAKSLLHRQPGRNTQRADMLETTREFALQELETSGEAELARERLAAYAAGLAAAAAAHLADAEQGAWLDRLEDEHANLREALAWAIGRGDADRALSLCGNLWRYWWSRGYLSEGRDWLNRALALPGPVDRWRRGYALNGAASLAESQGDFAAASAFHREALANWQQLGSAAGKARALSGLGTAAAHRGEYASARAFHEQALAIVRATDDALGTARILDRLGTVSRHQGELDRAETYYSESLSLFRQHGDLVNASIVLSNLGEVCHQQGRVDRAAELFEEALRLQRELDLPDGVAFDLTNLARVCLDLGEHERAAALSAQAVRIFRDMGNRLGLAGALAVLGLIETARDDPAQGAAYLRESLRLLAALDERSAMPEHLEYLAAALVRDDRAERAARLLGAAAALRERIDAPASSADREAVARTVDLARGALGEDRAKQAFAAGRALTLDAALAEALDDKGLPGTPPPLLTHPKHEPRNLRDVPWRPSPIAMGEGKG
jgi:predicted ATPase/DNA-binding SARP family transcriptional activator